MNKPNILWITVDACRKDMFYKLPYIKKLAKKSIVFENAFANAPWTLPSVASMFTGLYPSQHGALNEKTKLKKNVKTIAEILTEKGYNTIIITQNDGWITPYYGLTRGFKKIYDIEKLIEESLKIKLPKSKKKKLFIRMLVKYFIGYDVLTVKLLKNIIENANEPWFIYVHLMDTHMPYEPKTFPLLAFIRYLVFYKKWKEKMQRTWIGEKSFTERELRMLKKLYLKAIKNVDKQIQKAIKLLNEEKTTLIITADHGENIGEHGMVGHQFSFHDTLLRVPLIIYTPLVKAKKIKTFFETKDIFYLLQDIIEASINNFYERDYIFGENVEIEAVFDKLKNFKSDLSKGGKFIRTSKVKYIKYMEGKEELYKLEKNSENIFEDHELLKNLRSLMLIKEIEINKIKLREIR